MASHLRSLFMSLVAAIAVAATVATAQQAVPSTSAQTAPLTQTIPVDPQIRTRTLPNGLRYYVRANRQPQGRAELRLAVKAGSVLEDDDQRGLAHFVEHMSFNGTRNFPKQDVVAFMQGLGMRFGAHVNAHTGFDETVYQLQIPAGNPAIIDRSLLILEDWAQNVSFDPQEVERERGVILEEWRLGLGAQARVQDAQMPVLLSGSRYAERSPIGRPDIIRTASRDRLKQFYTDWYRPDLMAVIAVGDFDPAAVETAIVAHFGPIPAAVSPRPRPGADRARSTRHALHRGHRQGSHDDHRRRVQPDGGSRSADRGRLSAADGRTAVQRPALRPAGRDREQAGRAVPGGADVARAARPRRRSDRAQRARPR